jgi:ribosomal protein S18 acetylase RimI-like enzyme
MIDYEEHGEIGVPELKPFFKGWRSPPSEEVRARMLAGSAIVVTARDGGRLVGFVTAITDGVMNAYISLAEVLDEYQGRGVGSEMMKIVIRRLKGHYCIALLTDPDKDGFYSKLGFSQIHGMHIMDFTYGGNQRDE